MRWPELILWVVTGIVVLSLVIELPKALDKSNAFYANLYTPPAGADLSGLAPGH